MKRSVYFNLPFLFTLLLVCRLPGMENKNSSSDTLVTLTDITTELCPTRNASGDREFGRAPLVNISAKLEITPDGSGLIAVINFDARERGVEISTASRVTGVFRPRVYTAPAGRRITGLKPSSLANTKMLATDFVGSDAGPEFGACKEGKIAIASPGGFVKRIVWVGDTGGDDIAVEGKSCYCDTKIKSVEFNKVTVIMTRR